MYTILFFILLSLSIVGFSIAYNRNNYGFTIGSVMFIVLFVTSLLYTISV